jgi:hypothetical protein
MEIVMFRMSAYGICFTECATWTALLNSRNLIFTIANNDKNNKWTTTTTTITSRTINWKLDAQSTLVMHSMQVLYLVLAHPGYPPPQAMLYIVLPRSSRYNSRFLEHGAIKRNGFLSFLTTVRKFSSFLNIVTYKSVTTRKQKSTLLWWYTLQWN